ncbi:TPA: hypothetical protein ACQ0F8_001811 [Streptococcus agalactiae]|nr:hypothetical protein [Streptococcus agalactiae]HEO4177376.1 hypothetical protein [Streptococcus agalactiae]
MGKIKTFKSVGCSIGKFYVKKLDERAKLAGGLSRVEYIGLIISDFVENQKNLDINIPYIESQDKGDKTRIYGEVEEKYLEQFRIFASSIHLSIKSLLGLIIIDMVLNDKNLMIKLPIYDNDNEKEKKCLKS